MSSFPGLTALINARTYHINAPQSPVVPFVTYHKIDGQRYSGMGEDSGIVSARFQFEAIAATSASLIAVKPQVILALQRWRDPASVPEVIDAVISELFDERDETTGLYRGVLDATIHHRE